MGINTLSMKFFHHLPWQGIAARIAGLLFALFISIFALDVFEEELGFWKTIAALGIHLIPSFFILLVILISWKYEWLGALVFFLLGVMYIFTRQADPIAYVLIAGPMILIGILFAWSWYQQRKSGTTFESNR